MPKEPLTALPVPTGATRKPRQPRSAEERNVAALKALYATSREAALLAAAAVGLTEEDIRPRRRGRPSLDDKPMTEAQRAQWPVVKALLQRAKIQNVEPSEDGRDTGIQTRIRKLRERLKKAEALQPYYKAVEEWAEAWKGHVLGEVSAEELAEAKAVLDTATEAARKAGVSFKPTGNPEPDAGEGE